MTEANQANQSKQHSSRRGRGGGKNRGGRKNYASEGDALTDMPTPAGTHTGTPAKAYAGNTLHTSQSTRSIKRGVRKSTPSNIDVSATPKVAGYGQRTPPLTDPVNARLIPSNTAAYASSSSFHSPAPNTLPRPAFVQFTKSETSAHTREGTFSTMTSESVNTQLPKGPSPSASDSEVPSPSQHISSRVQQEAHEFLLQQGTAADRDIRRASSASAAVPFSAPSRSQSGPYINDAAIPLVLPRRPAQRGMSDHNSSLSSSVNQSNALGRSIHQSLPTAEAFQPYTQHLSAQSSQAQQAQPNMPQFSAQHTQIQPTPNHRQHLSAHIAQAQVAQPRMQQYSRNENIPAAPTQGRYISPQPTREEAAQPHAHYSSPQHAAAHVNQRPHFATAPPTDSSEELKKLLWGGSTPSPQVPASAPGRPNHPSTPSCGDAPPSGPHLRGGSTDPSAGEGHDFGGHDPRKSLAEDALRKVLGLNFPLSMSSGLDGNHSPQNRFSGHA